MSVWTSWSRLKRPHVARTRVRHPTGPPGLASRSLRTSCGATATRCQRVSQSPASFAFSMSVWMACTWTMNCSRHRKRPGLSNSVCIAEMRIDTYDHKHNRYNAICLLETAAGEDADWRAMGRSRERQDLRYYQPLYRRDTGEGGRG